MSRVERIIPRVFEIDDSESDTSGNNTAPILLAMKLCIIYLVIVSLLLILFSALHIRFGELARYIWVFLVVIRRILLWFYQIGVQISNFIRSLKE